ncbi:internal scaffolding protein [Microviridae sp.]|nr:internal scaffolding protein [Microviridae sp.]
MSFRTAFNNRPKSSRTSFNEVSLTKRSFAPECDINYIMAKHAKTGMIDHVNRFEGDYSDLPAAPDLHTALNAVKAAEAAFMSLPAVVRSKFSNNPEEFLSFVENPDNASELVNLGLCKTPLEDFIDKSSASSGLSSDVSQDKQAEDKPVKND